MPPDGWRRLAEANPLPGSSPLLGLPGAVASEQHPGLAAHYGEPLPEQRRLEAGAAFAELPRAVVSVTGPDRLSWLDSMTSQRLTGLAPGSSAETLVLDQNGRIEHAVRVVDDGETAWLIAEPENASALAAWLDRMRFMLRVEVAEHPELAVLGAVDASGLPASAPAGVPLVWDDPWREVAAGGWQYAAAAEHPGDQWRWNEAIVPREALAALAESVRAGERAASGLLAAEALRIAAWRPRQGADTDERTIPHELDWLRSAVHLTKGCYRGQETVAKVHNLGHPPRRLVMLHLDGSDGVLPAPGAEVLLGEKVIGAITSSALHHELGPIALAVVRRGADAEAELLVRAEGLEIAAAQQVIVPPGAGATADVPRLPRLGAVRRER